ncbi:MAG: hypothetical protein P8078_01750 [bacterium]
MDNKVKLQKIIAAYNPFPYDQIDLTQTIQDKYVAKEFKDSLANDICDTWKEINCTKLHNELFSAIKTGEDILTLLA